MEVTISRAEPADAAAILAIQYDAYRGEAEIYGDFSLPPLTQTLEQMRADFDTQVVLKACVEGAIAGSVRARQEGDTCFIGRLAVRPDLQNRGIGTMLMAAIEAAFPEARRFELFTGDRSARPIHLYEKLGYRVYKSEPAGPRVTLVFLQKSASA
jgi:ribosomal protein S18 acetylase RimI-like enzyme